MLIFNTSFWRIAVLDGVPSEKSRVPTRNAKLYSFNLQMHKQQRPPLRLIIASDGTIPNFITVMIQVPIPHQISNSDTNPNSNTCNEFIIIFRPSSWFKKQLLFGQSTFINHGFRRNINGFVVAKRKSVLYNKIKRVNI